MAALNEDMTAVGSRFTGNGEILFHPCFRRSSGRQNLWRHWSISIRRSASNSARSDARKCTWWRWRSLIWKLTPRQSRAASFCAALLSR